MQQHDEAFEHAFASEDNNDWKEACKLRNKVNHLCSLAKNEFTKKSINDYTSNTIEFWKKS